jgi:hypothetical protein
MGNKTFKNTIYLKNGSTVTNNKAENLAEQVQSTMDWSKGSINLKSEYVTTVVPKYYVAAVNSELEGENDRGTKQKLVK